MPCAPDPRNETPEVSVRCLGSSARPAANLFEMGPKKAWERSGRKHDTHALQLRYEDRKVECRDLDTKSLLDPASGFTLH